MSRRIGEATSLIDALVASSGFLVTKLWSGRWRGPPFCDEPLARLRKRLAAVLEVRAVQHQVGSVLTDRQAQDARLSEVVRPFEGLDALHHSPYTQDAWDAAAAQFAALMEPIERDVARRLQERLSDSGLRGHAQLREFLRFSELVRQPLIYAALAPAREALLGQLVQQIDAMRDEFETRSGQCGAGMHEGHQTTGKNLPEVVHQIILAKQLEDKALEMVAAADSLLSDLQGMPRFAAKARELRDYLRDHAQQRFAEWVAAVEAELEGGSSGLSLHLKGQLMHVNKDDLSLEVSYSDKLVRFLREVRQLTALGLEPPPSLQAHADLASRFYRHGVVLKQVAHFYNTIDTQIVRSQKPLLLEHAVRFEKLATEPQAQSVSGGAGDSKAITWSDPSQLEARVPPPHTHARTRRRRRRRRSLAASVRPTLHVPGIRPTSSNCTVLPSG